jgi:primosomal protein N' (replication factor Y) (superfamily II helicase)
VWIQTHQPDNEMLQSLITAGYPGFAERELAVRRSAGLPPYRPMILIRAEAEDAAAAERCLGELRDILLAAAGSQPGNAEVLGPAASPIPRIANRFRYQLMLLADTRGPLHRLARAVTREPLRRPGVRWSIDVDPYDTF